MDIKEKDQKDESKKFEGKKNATEIILRMDKLAADRKNYESTWQDVAHYVNPIKAFVTRTKTEGQKLDSDVYDSTAMEANVIMAAGFYSRLTNFSQHWFDLAMLKENVIQKHKSIKDYIQELAKTVNDIFNNSNLPNEIQECYKDIGTFGTMVLASEADPKDVVRYFSRPPVEIYIEEDCAGRVIAVYRKFQYTVRQAFDEWGEAAGKDVVKRYQKGDYTTKVDLVHYVGPRDVYDRSKKDKYNMPYESFYINFALKTVIEEGGYKELPYHIARYNKYSGDTYGTGPGHLVYSEIRMVNRMWFTLIRSAEKICDPPVILPHRGFIQPIKYYPGAVNYKTENQPNDKIEYLMSNGDIPVNLQIIQLTQEKIRKAFNVNLFRVLDELDARGKMTATEVMQRNADNMSILAPFIGSMMSDFLNPLIERTISIAQDAGKLPLPPQELLDLIAQDPSAADYKIIYTSPLAKAQKSEDLKNTTNFMGIIGEAAKIMPTVLDNVNGDKLIKNLADIQNIPADIINSPEEVKQIRDQRAKAQAEQAQMEKMQIMADMAHKGAGAFKQAKEGENVGKE